METSMNRRQIIVFDVNETLLDIDTLRPFFARTFGDEAVLRQWFGELVLYSQALTLSGSYTPFGQLAVAVLKMVAETREVILSAASIAEFSDQMADLPAHDDAAPALEMLRDAGFRLVTFTNSAPEAGRAVLAKAGLASYFEQQFSVDSVQRFKPAAATYRHVSTALAVEGSSLRLVAAHTWDIVGALAAGWKAALLARPGNAALPIGAQPDIVGKDLRTIATRIISMDG
jgi:2-haloacid dehalogenase